MPRLSPPRSRRVAVEEPLPGEEIASGETVVVELSEDDLEGLTVEVNEPGPAPEPADPDPDEAVRRAVEAQQRAEEIARHAQHERDDALRRERERQGELEQERGGREDAEYNGVLTSIAAEQAMLDKAEADYAAFQQAGEYTAAAKALRIISTASARLDRLEDNKSTFDARRAAPKTETRTAPAREAPASVEQQITALQLPDTAKTWLRGHPELVTDPSQNNRLGTVHRYITDVKGVAQFSPAYFEALDTELGFKRPVAPEVQPQPQQRKSMPMTAPVSREVPTSSGARPTSSQVHLSAEEVRIAHTSFTDPTGKMTNAEKERAYALNKMKLQKMRADGSYPSREQA